MHSHITDRSIIRGGFEGDTTISAGEMLVTTTTSEDVIRIHRRYVHRGDVVHIPNTAEAFSTVVGAIQVVIPRVYQNNLN